MGTNRMNIIHVFFLILKIMILIQFLLVLIKIQDIDDKTYLYTQVIFKVFLALYIQYIFFSSNISGISWEDKTVISFSAGLLLYDAIVVNLFTLLKGYGVNLGYLG